MIKSLLVIVRWLGEKFCEALCGSLAHGFGFFPVMPSMGSREFNQCAIMEGINTAMNHFAFRRIRPERLVSRFAAGFAGFHLNPLVGWYDRTIDNVRILRKTIVSIDKERVIGKI